MFFQVILFQPVNKSLRGRFQTNKYNVGVKISGYAEGIIKTGSGASAGSAFICRKGSKTRS
jgi:hypothetical protein